MKKTDCIQTYAYESDYMYIYIYIYTLLMFNKYYLNLKNMWNFQKKNHCDYVDLILCNLNWVLVKGSMKASVSIILYCLVPQSIYSEDFMHFLIKTPYSICLTRCTMHLLHTSRPVPHSEMRNSVLGNIVFVKLITSPRLCVITSEGNSLAYNNKSPLE